MSNWTQTVATGRLILADGTVIEGAGCGATGEAVGEICFNTAMTGYQEILTDPSYASQIIVFTFPHIGNVGTNADDVENLSAQAVAVRGCVLRAPITEPSNFRAQGHLDTWLAAHRIVAISGVDTRALTNHIRQNGMPGGLIAHHPDGQFDIPALCAAAATWPGLEGVDLARQVSTQAPVLWQEAAWNWTPEGGGFVSALDSADGSTLHVVAIDYGIKRNILRQLTSAGCRVSVVPATMPARDILALDPDGVFLSNGPGDPAATGTYAAPVIRALIDSKVPIFGICLGHQILALALGAKTIKMHQGHHGANHPVRDETTDKVEITSMNHGFAVDRDTLPEGIKETHISLFDGSNCGLALGDRDQAVFSVQHHPEASPGPKDSAYLFARFVEHMRRRQQAEAANPAHG